MAGTRSGLAGACEAIWRGALSRLQAGGLVAAALASDPLPPGPVRVLAIGKAAGPMLEAAQALSQVASAVSAFISGTLAVPLATISISLIYYDQRVRKEAFDLQYMMSTMGGDPPQPAPA